jgi:hypothetical protein
MLHVIIPNVDQKIAKGVRAYVTAANADAILSILSLRQKTYIPAAISSKLPRADMF